MFPWCLLMPTAKLLWLQREGRRESPLQVWLNFILTISQIVLPKFCNLQAEDPNIFQCIFMMTDCLSNPVVCLLCLKYIMTYKVWIIVQLSDGWVIKNCFLNTCFRHAHFSAASNSIRVVSDFRNLFWFVCRKQYIALMEQLFLSFFFFFK